MEIALYALFVIPKSRMIHVDNFPALKSLRYKGDWGITANT